MDVSYSYIWLGNHGNCIIRIGVCYSKKTISCTHFAWSGYGDNRNLFTGDSKCVLL
ncbi:hypothetical protein LBU54_13785 [Winogradskyella sp. D23]|uniref:BPTI/Kunitz inhibitor domain-containing protein n=1 Tax=Winogradskyella alexanderae TaxID=2877123 RepID=A0ABS7XUF3_9FLAO|nr:hypothetical protein [Winogradskyella alexanderae]